MSDARPLPVQVLGRLDADREAQMLTREPPGRALADLSDAEFERGIARIQLTRQRIERLLAGALIEGEDYGNPEDRGGRKAFPRPILYEAGAETLRRVCRYVLVQQPGTTVVEASEAYVSVTVTMGIRDLGGRVLATASANCNTRESRFRKRVGGGWIYTDAREALHGCLAMAEKRAGVRVTREAAGATPFFQNEEILEAAAAVGDEPDRPITPWTEAEKTRCGEAASGRGLGRKAFAALVLATLSRTTVGSGPDVERILAAIGAWTPSPSAPAEPVASPPPAAPPRAPAPVRPERTVIPADRVQDAYGGTDPIRQPPACPLCQGAMALIHRRDEGVFQCLARSCKGEIPERDLNPDWTPKTPAQRDAELEAPPDALTSPDDDGLPF